MNPGLPDRGSRAAWVAGVLAAGALVLATRTAAAEVAGAPQLYTPVIWIDPDGCEHWVMDDGFEGYATPRRTRSGRAVCHPVRTCLRLDPATAFRPGTSVLTEPARVQLRAFFRSSRALSHVVEYVLAPGTDERAAQLRAERIARLGDAEGVNVATAWTSRLSGRPMARRPEVLIRCVVRGRR